MTSRGRYRRAGAMLFFLLTLAPTASAQPLTTLRPAEPQPAQVTPGLAVEYTYARVNTLNSLRDGSSSPARPWPTSTTAGAGTF